MKIEKLNENLDHIEMADKTYDVINHTYATAIRDHKSNVERITKMMKERSKDAVQGERQPKTIKNAMLKRMHLSESIFDNTHPLGKQKVHEANKDLAIDLSKVKTSMTSILSELSTSNQLQKCKDATEIFKLVEATFKEKNLNTPKSRELLGSLERATNISEAHFLIYNSILKGSKLGVVKEAKERIWTYDTEDGEEWYDMASFIEDHLSRSDITRPDEQVLNRIARISDTHGVSYKNLGRDKNDWVTAKVPLGKYSEDTDEIEISDNEQTQANAKVRADKVIEAARKIAEMYKLGFDANKNVDEKFYEFKIEVPKDSIGQVYCIGDWFEENGLDLNMALTPAYQKRLAKREQLFANPDKNEEFLGEAKNESLTEDLKYGQTKYEELVGKIREYWDAPAIDNLCELMKDIDEQAAYDLIYKCAEFLEEHADEAIEDSQKYPIEKPKAKDSTFVSAKDKQPKKDLLTENVGFDAIIPLVKEWFNFLGDEDCENIAQDFAIGLDEGKDCFEILNKLSKTYDFEVSEFEGICPEIEKLTGLNESVVMNEEAKIISDLWSFEPWSGAEETLDKIKDANLMDELDSLLEDMYPDGITETELNDLLRFDDEWVLEALGISTSEDDEDDED